MPDVRELRELVDVSEDQGQLYWSLNATAVLNGSTASLVQLGEQSLRRLACGQRPTAHAEAAAYDATRPEALAQLYELLGLDARLRHHRRALQGAEKAQVVRSVAGELQRALAETSGGHVGPSKCTRQQLQRHHSHRNPIYSIYTSIYYIYQEDSKMAYGNERRLGQVRRRCPGAAPCSARWATSCWTCTRHRFSMGFPIIFEPFSMVLSRFPWVFIGVHVFFYLFFHDFNGFCMGFPRFPKDVRWFLVGLSRAAGPGAVLRRPATAAAQRRQAGGAAAQRRGARDPRAAPLAARAGRDT